MKGMGLFGYVLLILVLLVGLYTTARLTLGASPRINDILPLIPGLGEKDEVFYPYPGKNFIGLTCDEVSCYGIHLDGDNIFISKTPIDFKNGDTWGDHFPRSFNVHTYGASAPTSSDHSNHKRSGIQCVLVSPAVKRCFVVWEDFTDGAFTAVGFLNNSDSPLVISGSENLKDADSRLSNIQPRSGFNCDSNYCYLLGEIDPNGFGDWIAGIRFPVSLSGDVKISSSGEYKCPDSSIDKEDPDRVSFGCDENGNVCFMNCYTNSDPLKAGKLLKNDPNLYIGGGEYEIIASVVSPLYCSGKYCFSPNMFFPKENSIDEQQAPDPGAAGSFVSPASCLRINDAVQCFYMKSNHNTLSADTVSLVKYSVNDHKEKESNYRNIPCNYISSDGVSSCAFTDSSVNGFSCNSKACFIAYNDKLVKLGKPL